MHSNPRHLFLRFAYGVLLCIVSATATANEVTIRHKGISLNAKLALAGGKTLADGAILITHGGLAHRDMELIATLSNLLQQKGYSVLAINLSLGLDQRHGMYDCKITHRHHNADAAEEIGVWVNWLAQQGAGQVVLMGHSRGAAQTALYAAEQNHALVKALVLIAPAISENTEPAEYQRRFQKPFAPVLEKARKLIKVGKGETVLKSVGLLTCPETSATAGAFVSYYGQSPSVDAPYLIPKLRQPTLVLVAGSDEVVPGLAQKMTQIADGLRVKMKIIDGADHTFRDIYTDEAVDAIDGFLKSVWR